MMRAWSILLAGLWAMGCGDSHGGSGDDAGGGDLDAGPEVDAPPPPPRDSGPGDPDAGPPDEDAGTDAGSEECDSPGTIETVPCGSCGQQDRYCTSAGVWDYLECIPGPGAECDPGSVMMASCGMCGTQRVLCDTECHYVASGACMGETGECLAGRTEIDRAGCGMSELRTRVCGSDCSWEPYGACEPIPDDFDGDGVPYATDCDDNNASVVIGSTRNCGSYFCVGMMGPQFDEGTQTCVGPGWSACVRDASCTPTTMCGAGTSEREECATECVPGGPARTRSCSMGTWGAWSACSGGRGTRPASCDDPGTATCGECGEGIAYEICDAACNPVTVGCMGTGCTPGATTRTTMGCPAGQYRESTCSMACVPGAPGVCRPYPPDVDVMILVDVTGSHTGLVMRNARTLANDLAATLLMDADVRVGVALFADFPEGPFGGSGDVPYRGVLAPTSNLMMVQSSLESLPGMGGGDGPESGVEALWSLSGGTDHPQTEPFACPAGTDPGGCWRRGGQRIVVMVTDITQHNGPELDGTTALHSPYGDMIDPPAAEWPDVAARMRAQGVALFALVPESGWAPEFDGDTQARLMAEDLGQDPAISVVAYPTGAMDWSAEVRELAGNIATYVGITP